MHSGFVEACAKTTRCFPTDNHTSLSSIWRASPLLVTPPPKWHYTNNLTLVTVCKLAKSSSSLLLSVKRPHLYTGAGSDSFLILYQLSNIIPDIKRKVQADTYMPRQILSYRQTWRPHVGRCGVLHCNTFANLSTSFLGNMQTAFGSKQQEVGLELKLWGSVMNHYHAAVF